MTVPASSFLFPELTVVSSVFSTYLHVFLSFFHVGQLFSSVRSPLAVGA